MKKLVYIVCGLNASRSQAIEEFLQKKYSDNSEVEIKSAGLDVHLFKKEDKRTLFKRELAEKAEVIFVSDDDKFYRINYRFLDNHSEKMHSLRIPDFFYAHRNGVIDKEGYDAGMKKIIEDSDFSRLREYINALSLKECSALTEALFIKELYSAHKSPESRQDKKYPFELLYKTLEFRFPEINKIIKQQ